MTDFLQRLDLILDNEYKILLEGRISELERLTELKLQLLSLFSASLPSLPEQKIKQILRKSKKNDELLMATQRGIKAAMRQVKEAKEGSFQSYSKDGFREPLSNSVSIQKRL